MSIRSTRACLNDLEKHGHLLRVKEPVDGHLEVAEIQRRVYQNQGPALLFEQVKGSRFPMASNIFGTTKRTEFLFRHTLDHVRRLVDLKIDPNAFWKNPFQYARALPSGLNMLPRARRSGAILKNRIALNELPQMVSWPDDGGPYITLPQVYSEDCDAPGLMKSNLGMYRVQLAGNEYDPQTQVGLHYQIHRSIGVHHAKAIAKGEPFRVNIFVGGTPAMTLAAVMPLPEGMSELMFAGALAGHRIPMVRRPDGIHMYADADFCIVGTVDPNRQMPEGPFGDHLGYYSLVHDFPVLNVEAVYHRDDAVWPLTVVGRPPQEDTSFGHIIHEITGPVIPTVIAGVKEVHAVDAAGVHPLLLAIGSERYVPYAAERSPQELLTCANAILGQGQLSLAKYLLIAAGEDDPSLTLHEIGGFFQHCLKRVDWTRDLHFQTKTTIDTLDYSGQGFNSGSKVVIAVAGEEKRTLPTELPNSSPNWQSLVDARAVMPGVLAIQCDAPFQDSTATQALVKEMETAFDTNHPWRSYPLWILCDDAAFCAESLNNFLWVTFTRSNPATDLHGFESFVDHKHWGCRGPVIIDARIKPHHAPPLIEDSAVSRRVDELGTKGHSLHGLV